MADLAPTAPCYHCGWSLVGPDWGYVVGHSGPWNDCIHVTEQRYCPSCSEDWYRVGAGDAWDIDGCAREVCPSCAAEGITLADCRRPPPREEDGEAFRGGEAAACQREAMAQIQRERMHG